MVLLQLSTVVVEKGVGLVGVEKRLKRGQFFFSPFCFRPWQIAFPRLHFDLFRVSLHPPFHAHM